MAISRTLVLLGFAFLIVSLIGSGRELAETNQERLEADSGGGGYGTRPGHGHAPFTGTGPVIKCPPGKLYRNCLPPKRKKCPPYMRKCPPPVPAATSESEEGN